MRTIAVFVKALREMRRDPLVVALTLVFAPCFVVMYYVVFPSTVPVYRVAIVNEDAGASWEDGGTFTAGSDVEAALAAFQGPADQPLLEVSVADSEEQGRARIDSRESTLMLVIPDGFSQAIATAAADPGQAPSATYTLVGDLTNPEYVVTAALVDATVREYVEQATGLSAPVQPVEEPIGGSGSRTSFEIYVPGLVVFAVIMLIFLAAMTVAREIESGAMRRLRATRMTATEYLTGTSAVVMLVGVAGVTLTFVTAWACGFRSRGPLWVGVVALAITTLSVIGIGMMVAAVSRSVPRAFVIANFPLGVLMFFSGSMLPIPQVTWFEILGHPVGPFELLAPTHAVTVVNKVFTLGAGFGDVAFEMVALVVLTAAYFACGVALLRRSQLRAD